MKKEVLFIISDMESGGFQKSLISLLECLDFSKYNVDLLILSPMGIFLNKIPKEVYIRKISLSGDFFKRFPKCIINLLRGKNFLLALKRCIHFIISIFDKGMGGRYMSKQIPGIDKEYDVAIDYNGQQILYYMVDKIKAKKKITYFHSDYRKWSYYLSADKLYYPKVDNIVTISEICKMSLDEFFPSCATKIKVIHNISSPKIIKRMSEEICPIEFDSNYTNIIMVGRPSELKGYDFAIEACAKLKKEGNSIRIYSIGTSNEVEEFKRLVKKFELGKEFIFIGETENPYTFMRQADIYLHPSRFEGKSVAIDEAKILCKPIIISNFTTSKDHINNEVNGLIVKMDSNGVYEGIKRMIDNKELRNKFSYNLSKEKLGNENEVYKLYKLID